MKGTYIRLLFLGIICVLLTISILTYKNLSNYTREVKSIRHSNKVVATLEIVLSALKDAEIGHRGYQLTHDSTYLEPYHSSVSILPKELKMLDSLARANPLQSRNVDSLKILTNNQFVIISRILSNAQRSSLYMDRYESNLLKESRHNMDRIRRIARDIKEDEEQYFKDRLAKETDFRNIAPISLLFYGLVPLAGIIFLFTRLLNGLEQKKVAEDKLKKNNQELRREVAVREFTQKTLRSVLDNSLDGIMAFRSIRNKHKEIEDFEWILANKISLNKTMRTESERIGKRLLVEMPGNKTEGLFDIYKEVVESGKPQKIEKYYQSEGLGNWFNITAVKLEDGFVVTFSDITSQKSQQLLTEERELLLKEAEHVSNMGSWKWTEKQNVLIWSDGLYKILGKTMNQTPPTWDSFLDNVYSEDFQLLQKFILGIKINRANSKLDYRIELNGNIRYLSIIAKPIQQDDSVFPDILGTVIDITERMVYENQLKQFTAELQRSNEDLEQFAYVASHDLQEPLRKIRAFGDLAVKNYNKTEGLKADYIQRMQSAAARMQLLIEDLLTFSRISRNTKVFESLMIKPLLEEVIDDLHIKVKSEKAIVGVGDIPDLKGERTQIKRLFQNLISNAIKFHKPDQQPTINIGGRICKNTEIFEDLGILLPAPEYIRISVKDNGIGFDEKYAEKIFNIFQRLHGRSEYEGTGIGLSICRKIVNNHQGFITARSNENIGSEFIVILPVQ